MFCHWWHLYNKNHTLTIFYVLKLFLILMVYIVNMRVWSLNPFYADLLINSIPGRYPVVGRGTPFRDNVNQGSINLTSKLHTKVNIEHILI